MASDSTPTARVGDEETDVDVSPFRTALEWATLRATDIELYRAELTAWCARRPTDSQPYPD